MDDGLYDTDNYLYLRVSWDEESDKCITLLKAENKKYEYLRGFGKYVDFDYFEVEAFWKGKVLR